MTAVPVRRSVTPPVFDRQPGPARAGLILLATDLTTERDFARMVDPSRLSVYASRIAYENPTTPENLAKMQPRLTEGARLILPAEDLDVICYACTAASVVIGDDAVTAAIAAGKPGTPVVTPPAAARAGFAALGVSRISILTPYLEETSRPMARYFTDRGFDVRNLDCFGLDDDRRMARVTPETLVRAAVAAMSPEAEALFVSCTALRAAEVAAEIEAAIGRPVVTSNQASVWMTLRLAGIEDPLPGHGRLLTLPLPGGRVAT